MNLNDAKKQLREHAETRCCQGQAALMVLERLEELERKEWVTTERLHAAERAIDSAEARIAILKLEKRYLSAQLENAQENVCDLERVAINEADLRRAINFLSKVEQGRIMRALNRAALSQPAAPSELPTWAQEDRANQRFLRASDAPAKDET